MPTVDPVKVLNIDNVPYAVDAMSEKVKSMVSVYDEWNQKLTDAQDEVGSRRAALNDLSRTIIMAVREEQEAAKKAVEDAEAAAKAEAEAKAATPAPAVQGTTAPVAAVAEAAPVAEEAAVAPELVKTGDADA